VLIKSISRIAENLSRGFFQPLGYIKSHKVDVCPNVNFSRFLSTPIKSKHALSKKDAALFNLCSHFYKDSL